MCLVCDLGHLEQALLSHPHTRNPCQLEATSPPTGPAKAHNRPVTWRCQDSKCQALILSGWVGISLCCAVPSRDEAAKENQNTAGRFWLLSKVPGLHPSTYLQITAGLGYAVHPPGIGRACPACSLACSKQGRSYCEAWHGEGAIAVSSTALSWSWQCLCHRAGDRTDLTEGFHQSLLLHFQAHSASQKLPDLL